MNPIQNSLPLRFLRSLDDTDTMLLTSIAFCFGLQAFRIIYTGQLLFSFLVWNLFLAWLPYAISRVLTKGNYVKSKAFFPLAFLWLLFIPNSFYIITDLFHLDMNTTVPLWFDLALLVAFAWCGLVLGMVSVRQMEKLIEQKLQRPAGLFLTIPVMALNGLGIYLGRYERFNSWDIINNPFSLFSSLADLIMHPLRNRFDWSMIVCYAGLLTVIYLGIRALGRSWK